VVLVPEQPTYGGERRQDRLLHRYRWPGAVDLALVDAVECDRLLQEVGYAVLVGLAVSGEPVEGLEEDLGVQCRPQFEQDAGLLVGVVPPPVGCAGRDGCLLSLPEPSLHFTHLDTKGAGEDFEMLRLERMDVKLVAAAGRNDKLAPQQLPARIPSALLEHYPVPLDRVIDLLSCPRHVFYLIALRSSSLQQPEEVK
jgi:hypothetical protein